MVLYENGTVVPLSKEIGVLDRNRLIAASDKFIKNCASVPGTPLGDFYPCKWGDTIPAPKFESRVGVIIAIAFPAFELTVIDVVEKELTVAEMMRLGCEARCRKDKDVANRKVVATSVDV
jgi:hypothetical protein